MTERPFVSKDFPMLRDQARTRGEHLRAGGKIALDRARAGRAIFHGAGGIIA